MRRVLDAIPLLGRSEDDDDQEVDEVSEVTTTRLSKKALKALETVSRSADSLTEEERNRAENADQMAHLSPHELGIWITEGRAMNDSDRRGVEKVALEADELARRVQLENQIKENSDKGTFKKYVSDVWGMAEARVTQFVNVHRVVLATKVAGLPAPPNERVVRELALVTQRDGGDVEPLREDEQRRIAEAFQTARTQADERGVQLTAKFTREVLEQADFIEAKAAPAKQTAASVLLAAEGDLTRLEHRLIKFDELQGNRKASNRVRDLARGYAERLENLLKTVEAIAGQQQAAESNGQPEAVEAA
jgi:hypothetical protein